MNELISVIIPVYNAEKYLNRCLDSVLNNTYKNLEVILVDDGSTDMSGRICDEYAKKDCRIRVLHKENGGTARARNTGLKIAKGDYIAFVDNDDFVHPCFYEYMLSSMESSSADVAICELTRDMQVDEFNSNKSIIPQLVNKHDFIKETDVLSGGGGTGRVILPHGTNFIKGACLRI